jgi:hypothetical protein
MNSKKPDRSLATKSGHLHLLRTEKFSDRVVTFFDEARRGQFATVRVAIAGGALAFATEGSNRG